MISVVSSGSAEKPSRSWLPVAAALVVAGWGANQFTPLSVVYHETEDWSHISVVGMFTVYLLGLVPALLLGCRIADRVGARRTVRAAVLVTAVSSVVLALAPEAEPAGYVSRLLTGASTGLVLSAGAAWIKALSAPGTGMRRDVYATGAGFVLGPLIAGMTAEWLPHPAVLPCLLHSALAVVALVLTRRVPDATTSRAAAPAPLPSERWEAVTHPRFVGVVLPASPAVFAATTVAYVVLPPLVVDRVGHFAPLFSGAVAALTLAVGLAVQPAAAWLDRIDTARSTVVAMATVVIGLLIGAVAVDRSSPLLVLAAAVVLGAGYGLILASGLREIDRLASPATLPTAAAFYQGVAHSGFLTPLLLAVTAASDHSYPQLLAVLAAAGLFFLCVTAVVSRRHAPGDVDLDEPDAS